MITYLGRLPDKGEGEDARLIEQGDVQQRGSATLMAALQQSLSRIGLTKYRLKAALPIQAVVCCPDGLSPQHQISHGCQRKMLGATLGNAPDYWAELCCNMLITD